MKNSQLKIQEGPKNRYSFVKSIFELPDFWGANFRPLRVVQVFLFVVLWERGWGTIWRELIYIHSQYVVDLLCGLCTAVFLSNCSQRDCEGPKCLACRTGVNFFAYLSEQRRKRGERETRVAREGRSAKKIMPVLQATKCSVPVKAWVYSTVIYDHGVMFNKTGIHFYCLYQYFFCFCFKGNRPILIDRNSG